MGEDHGENDDNVFWSMVCSPPKIGRRACRRKHPGHQQGGSNRAGAQFSGIHELLWLGGAPQCHSASVRTVSGITRIVLLTKETDGETLERYRTFLLARRM